MLRRHVRKTVLTTMLSAGLCAGLAIATPGVALANTIAELDACAWTNGPVASSGCSYATDSGIVGGRGAAAWVGGGNPAVAGPVFGTQCEWVNNVGGACIYGENPTGPSSVTVTVPNSTTGVAGDSGLVAGPASIALTACPWLPGSGGCSYGTQAGDQGAFVWVGTGGPPALGGATLNFCENASPDGGGICTYTATGTVVTIFAPALTAGVATNT